MLNSPAGLSGASFFSRTGSEDGGFGEKAAESSSLDGSKPWSPRKISLGHGGGGGVPGVFGSSFKAQRVSPVMRSTKKCFRPGSAQVRNSHRGEAPGSLVLLWARSDSAGCENMVMSRENFN